MIDTHCHLNLSPLNDAVEQYIDEAKASGVTHFIVPGVDLETSKASISLAQQFSECFAAVGVHPEEAARLDDEAISLLITRLEELITSSEVVKAVGECGLDLFRVEKGSEDKVLALQKDLFTKQVELAHQKNLPVIIHVREAQTHVLDILRTHKPRGVLHCFSGDEAYLRESLDLGLYISFAGNVTFKNAEELRRLLAIVPLERLLLETDSPFLNPKRGVFPNQPAHITYVYQLVAEIKKLPVPQLEEIVLDNAKTLFNL